MSHPLLNILRIIRDTNSNLYGPLYDLKTLAQYVASKGMNISEEITDPDNGITYKLDLRRARNGQPLAMVRRITPPRENEVMLRSMINEAHHYGYAASIQNGIVQAEILKSPLLGLSDCTLKATKKVLMQHPKGTPLTIMTSEPTLVQHLRNPHANEKIRELQQLASEHILNIELTSQYITRTIPIDFANVHKSLRERPNIELSISREEDKIYIHTNEKQFSSKIIENLPDEITALKHIIRESERGTFIQVTTSNSEAQSQWTRPKGEHKEMIQKLKEKAKKRGIAIRFN